MGEQATNSPEQSGHLRHGEIDYAEVNPLAARAIRAAYTRRKVLRQKTDGLLETIDEALGHHERISASPPEAPPPQIAEVEEDQPPDQLPRKLGKTVLEVIPNDLAA